MRQLIDTHCHLHDREFFTADQAETMLKRASQASVKQIICIGTSYRDSLVARDFAAQHENVYWTYGVHPQEAQSRHLAEAQKGSLVDEHFSDELNFSDELHFSDETNPPIAIGEVGLDYHYEGHNRDAQIRLFEQMLQLATDHNLPLSFHVREAFADFLPVVANFPDVHGVVHSFTDSKKTLKRILNETEFYIGVNGLATYSTLPLPPLERILLETDAPFLTPVPFRGIINEPAYVREIATWLSARLGVEFKIIEEETTNNARKLFNFRNSDLRQT